MISKRMNRMRLIGMSIASFIATLTISFSFRSTSSLDSNASTTINASGKQRMLAQRLLTNAFKVDDYIRTEQWTKLDPTLINIRETASEFGSSHAKLLGSENSIAKDLIDDVDFQDALLVANRSAQELITAADELAKLTQSIIRRSPYIDEQTFIQTTAAKSEITASHALFSPAMNSIVNAYEHQNTQRTRSAIKRARMGLIVLLASLAGIAIFVIEPTFLIVRNQIVDLSNIIHKAKRANSIRWRLLTNIGNESRPITTNIISYANLLNEDSLSTSERTRLTNSIFESASKLSLLSETMIDLSAIESGNLRILNERCDLHALLNKVSDDSTIRAQVGGLNLSMLIDESCPNIITTDPKRLKQILHKLLDNAIEYTQAGHVLIKAKLINKQGSELIQLSIIDTGHGISKDVQHQLFDSYHQAEQALNKNISDTGLGLSISREIAKELGGNLELESSSTDGSTFIITVHPGKYEYTTPEDSPQSQPQPAAAKKPLAARRVLVVDSDYGTRILLEFILSQAGGTVDFATNSDETLTAVNSAIANNTPYDIIIADMQMSAYQGFFTAINLRKHEIKAPIIAISTCESNSDQTQSLKAGCNDWIPRPITKHNLIEACSKHIAQPNLFDSAA